MYNFCVFAGTTEGRELVEFLSSQNVTLTACVATEYGETLIPPAPNLTVSAKRLTPEQMEELFRKEHFDLVVDATHPYANLVTENILSACKASGVEYLRLLRDGGAQTEDAVYVSDVSEAVEYLDTTDGNILLTTGSKELHKFSALRDFGNRVYARVLPMEESLRLCGEAGLKPSHILAMQGPFSVEMNTQMLRCTRAQFLVTKDSGTAGGFEEKIASARDAGAKAVIIGRPPQRDGVCLSGVLSILCQRFSLRWSPRVDVIGIGPGSPDMISCGAREAVSKADCVIGAQRMVDAFHTDGKPFYHAITPNQISELIHNHREYRRFAVVMSGDVGFFSGAKKLLPFLEDCKVRVFPGISSLVYLCAKLGTSYEDVATVSLHGRNRSLIPDVLRHRRVFVLVGGENGAGKLCAELTAGGLGDVTVSVGEKLSYPEETVTMGSARELAHRTFDALSAVLVENPGANPVVTYGMDDERFFRDPSVPMTKSEVRSVCLSKLRLTRKSVCWDIGAGSGSVAIEMALLATEGHVYAIERKEEAVEVMRENIRRFGVENLSVVAGTAPEDCEMLPAPTHVFIGGSSGNMKQILKMLLQKNPNVRIVATAITLESIAELTESLREYAVGEVVCIQAARGKKAGAYHLMMGQNPVYIFTMQGEKR